MGRKELSKALAAWVLLSSLSQLDLLDERLDASKAELDVSNGRRLPTQKSIEELLEQDAVVQADVGHVECDALKILRRGPRHFRQKRI